MDLRRLAVSSALFILVGLLLLLASGPVLGLITSGSASTSSTASSGFGSSTGTTTTIESLLAFGFIGIGLVLEVFSLFTDVGPSISATEGAEARQP